MTHIDVRMSDELKAATEAAAKKDDRTVSAWIRRAIKAALALMDDETKKETR